MEERAVRASNEIQKTVLAVPGFRASGLAAGIKKTGRSDLALIVSDSPASVAGVFTTNRVKAPCIVFNKKRVLRKSVRGIVVNSGNANACTGKKGYEDTEAVASAVERRLGLSPGDMLVASTGVIGVPLPVERIVNAVPGLVEGLRGDGLPSAAEAIMTTDAFPKTAVASLLLSGRRLTVAGIAKGAGMICPNMATMLAFFMTDANIRRPALMAALRIASGGSFNSIIVDNDTSTNDMCLVFANGVAGGPEIREGTSDWRKFVNVLTDAAMGLAKMVVKDGEGATRVVEITVRGASTDTEARRAARTVAESFLVKTAFFGGDPNWGRIMAALGRSGIRMREEKVDISFNGVDVVRGGLDTGKESEAASAIKAPEVTVDINLRAGKGSSRVWTSDLTYDYVKINSAYRT